MTHVSHSKMLTKRRRNQARAKQLQRAAKKPRSKAGAEKKKGQQTA